MLLILRVMLVMLLPCAVLAQDFRPAETPPPDFSARQYIDSRGCVFLRDDATGGWQARVSRDGAPICGYPPTLSARGLDGKPRLRALDPDSGRSPAELLEEALAKTVLTNLRPGELASDPTPMQKLPDMGPEPDISTAPGEAVRAALAVVPDLRRSMGAALQPNRRLCELLGYDASAGPGAGLDPSQGYCDSLPASDLSRLTFTRPVGSSRTGSADAGAVRPEAAAVAAKPETPSVAASGPVASKPRLTPATTDPAMPAKTDAAKPEKSDAAKPKKKPAPKPAAAGRPESSKADSAPKAPVAGARATKAAAPAPGISRPQPGAVPSAPAGVIPAGARYVQVGTYANAANAERTAQALAAMGYAVLRGTDRVGTREVQFIMAGPFNDRQSIVKALDGIRRAGFRDAYPR